jgi:alkanesulfonate monooxygenase SsuD/methylene tetrahydromethanopterin reductase-like flavin-dependent oxidoreductase (luciferase family)
MELGLYTFVDRTPDPVTGATVTPRERVRDLLEEVELADEVGLDVFGIGEHHRPDYVLGTCGDPGRGGGPHVAHPADHRGQRAELR